jgi:hypothetical protein
LHRIKVGFVGFVAYSFPNKRPEDAKISVPFLICTARVYCSSDFDEFLMKFLGKSLSEKSLALLCSFYYF